MGLGFGKLLAAMVCGSAMMQPVMAAQRLFCDEYMRAPEHPRSPPRSAGEKFDSHPYESCRAGDWILVEEYYTKVLEYCDLDTQVIPIRSEGGRVRLMCRYAGQRVPIEYRNPLPTRSR